MEHTKTPTDTLWATCNTCRQQVEMSVVKADYEAWERSRMTPQRPSLFIQDAMPYLSDGEREILISGICNNCFDEMFGG